MMAAFWQDRPALVTGATGLLGSWLARRLCDLGADVVCLVRDWVPQSEFERAGLGARVKQVRGDVCDQAPYTEETPLQGRHPYDVSKSCADLIAQCYAATYGTPVAVTRCGNFYGGGDLNWNRIVPGTIRSVLRGERPVIRSDGQFVRDYLYVEDGAAAYTLLAERLAEELALRGQGFNFSNETQVTVLELVERILSLMGADLSPEVRNEASNEIRRQYLSARRAREVLGWRSLFPLDEGLKATIAWYRRFFADER